MIFDSKSKPTSSGGNYVTNSDVIMEILLRRAKDTSSRPHRPGVVWRLDQSREWSQMRGVDGGGSTRTRFLETHRKDSCGRFIVKLPTPMVD
ncbi:UNVERIFIED_CONTAM: hypothetical protein PYX00_005763 [Menopon gallinae]|uniref:Uncharacterized protein n=1 Tax=Menopon gallinae TaxID=328185 RepID=A0AAW2HTD7_9NEOP